MRSEATRTFRRGFNLTEQELRRIFDSVLQQMDKISDGNGKSVNSTFEVKFKNGVISNPSSLDEILALENIGSGSILRLKITVEYTTENSKSSIRLEFIDVDHDPASMKDSIIYAVVGDNRDWVFVTSSQLEERLARVTKLVPNNFFGMPITNRDPTPRQLIIYFLVALPFALILSIPIFLLIPSGVERRIDRQFQNLETIQERWHNGEFDDPIEVLLELRRLDLISEKMSRGFPGAFYEILYPLSVVFGILLLLSLAYFAWVYFSPAFNFLWGDYLTIYEKRQSQGKFVLIGVILTIVLSIASNYLTIILGIR